MQNLAILKAVSFQSQVITPIRKSRTVMTAFHQARNDRILHLAQAQLQDEDHCLFC